MNEGRQNKGDKNVEIDPETLTKGKALIEEVLGKGFCEIKSSDSKEMLNEKLGKIKVLQEAYSAIASLLEKSIEGYEKEKNNQA